MSEQKVLPSTLEVFCLRPWGGVSFT